MKTYDAKKIMALLKRWENAGPHDWTLRSFCDREAMSKCIKDLKSCEIKPVKKAKLK